MWFRKRKNFSANLWSQHHLFGTKIVLTFFALLVCFLSEGQNKRFDYHKFPVRKDHGVMNLPNYDEKPVHYGFYVGLNESGWRIRHSQAFLNNLNDTIVGAKSINSIRSVGVNLGFIFNFRLTHYFDARLLPGVGFYSRPVEFRMEDSTIVGQLDKSTFSFIELPILFKFKSERRRNFRFYVVGGIKPGFEVGAYRDQVDFNSLRTTTADVAIEYGFGCDIFYQMFKFSPEIRFSNGIINMVDRDPNVYSRSINRMTTNTISFILNFE